MKPDTAAVLTLLGALVCARPVAAEAQSIHFSGAGTIQEMFKTRQSSLVSNVRNGFYCYNKRCPNWKCQDDSAVIHGYCCGCPNALPNNIPVLCVDDLKCPLKPKPLCDDYRFMIICCCSKKL